MISKQETLNLSPYIALYDLIILSGFIWHGNTGCYNDICGKLETYIEVIKRKRVRITQWNRAISVRIE